MLVRINLTHYIKKNNLKSISRTIISINGIELIEVSTHGSHLKFLRSKLNKGDGQTNPGEYFFEVSDDFGLSGGGLI